MFKQKAPIICLKCVEPQIPTSESRGPERVVTVSGADTPTKAERVIGRVHLQYFLNVSALLPFRLPTPNGDIHYFLKNIYGPFNKVDYMNIYIYGLKSEELEGIFAQT